MSPQDAWWLEYIWKYGEPPDMGPGANYDYAKAIAAGVQPTRQDDGLYHWPSALPGGEMLKAADHPTRWMEEYYRKLGDSLVGTKPEYDVFRTLTQPYYEPPAWSPKK